MTSDLGSVADLAAHADMIVEDLQPGSLDARRLLELHPHLVIVSVSPFGRSTSWSDSPATEFVLQGWCGSMARRGLPNAPPLQAGGNLGEWATGAYAAASGVTAAMHARRTGRGEHVDVSMLEVMTLLYHPQDALEAQFETRDSASRRYLLIPSILPTRDGFVGVFLQSQHHVEDFLILVDSPALRPEEWLKALTRFERRDEFLPIVNEWSSRLTTDELIERLVAFRIPATPIGDGSTIPHFDHVRERNLFVQNSAGFLQPRVPYRISGVDPRPFGPAPDVAPSSTPSPPWRPRSASQIDSVDSDRLPLADVRIVDLTMYWAGPLATDMLAALGADVIKIESVTRPDGMRARTSQPEMENWWEYSPNFLVANRNKRGITLDLNDVRCIDLLNSLIETADVVIENFTPRVMDNFGLTWDAIREVNPQVLMVRMPGYGLDGPWTDRPAFAPTMEQMNGIASVTGYSEDEPQVALAPGDPLAAVHAAFAVLMGLESRRELQHGLFIEVPMIESGLSVTAEIVFEAQLSGRILRPMGNRSWVAAPQGAYACSGDDEWLAISVQTDAQWESLQEVLGHPDWADKADLATQAGRRDAHDEIDQRLSEFFTGMGRDDAVKLLLAAGVPAAPVVGGLDLLGLPQLMARRFFEEIDHPAVGRRELQGMPFRFNTRTEKWLRSAAPTLGQHNQEVLCGELKVDPGEFALLEEEGVIGQSWVG